MYSPIVSEEIVIQYNFIYMNLRTFVISIIKIIGVFYNRYLFEMNRFWQFRNDK